MTMTSTMQLYNTWGRLLYIMDGEICLHIIIKPFPWKQYPSMSNDLKNTRGTNPMFLKNFYMYQVT